VAAARARQADPIAAIKADVATRLAPTAGARAAGAKEMPATSQMQKSAALPATGTRSVAPGGQGDGASKAVTVGPAAAENAAQQKPAIALEPRTNPAPLIPAPTVKAPSFPAAIAGEE
jgi:conjugal transfer pilus assembly protein TraV